MQEDLTLCFHCSEVLGQSEALSTGLLVTVLQCHRERLWALRHLAMHDFIVDATRASVQEAERLDW